MVDKKLKVRRRKWLMHVAREEKNPYVVGELMYQALATSNRA